MSHTTKRLRTLVITVIAIAATNFAISFAAGQRSGVAAMPDVPRPKSGIAAMPDVPRPKSGIAAMPDVPRPKSGIAAMPDVPRP